MSIPGPTSPDKPDQGRPRRALLSVYDKTGLVDLAAGLTSLGWELLASRGTAAALSVEGVSAVDVADCTGFPPLLGHRVVTLHPWVHGGILADCENPDHTAELESNRIEPIDLVVVNLYPFDASPDVETIDIGGVALLRAAAKNHARVGAVVDPSDYSVVLAELVEHGRLSETTRMWLARKAFACTLAHDQAVIGWLDSREPSVGDGGSGGDGSGGEDGSGGSGSGGDGGSGGDDSGGDGGSGGDGSPNGSLGDDLPGSVHLTLERAEILRYGENPHQRAARYRLSGQSSFFDGVTLRGGVPLSYMNLADVTAAWGLACDLIDGLEDDRAAAVIVKHGSPCGAAVARSPAEAYELAMACDPQSAFGGVVAVIPEIDAAAAAAIVDAVQADVIISSEYEPGVCERLQARRAATRLLKAPAGSVAIGLEGASVGGLVEASAGGVGDRASVLARKSDLALGSTLDARKSDLALGSTLDRGWELCQLGDDFLLQSGRHCGVIDPSAWRVVTSVRPTSAELADAVFAWKVCAAVVSNAVVLAKECVAWGIGGGQPNRAEAGRAATLRAAGRAEGGVCASDGFYPFADGVEAAAAAGASVIVQPGGSVNDDKVIAAADTLGLSMLFTGQRQFRH